MHLNRHHLYSLNDSQNSSKRIVESNSKQKPLSNYTNVENPKYRASVSGLPNDQRRVKNKSPLSTKNDTSLSN